MHTLTVRRKPTQAVAVLIEGEHDPFGDDDDGLHILRYGPQRDEEAGQLNLWCRKSAQWCHVEVGDYAIQEPDKSGWYPCTSPVFDESYEVV